ncbi:glycosyltransferase family 2 protein [Hymenobacter artigasi]|uniref:Glycosyltransferase involved in cell wall biosynthesis n=1 Tax=Hymenobacter artigasi TaxID=2719616 RepID=A0ABX1HJ70_9BACT|nr:glycosyltransferase [Hymenobacter artigasi]NKI89092.1 glycosyltransferase involved in cell wall biosynthesis [Hymenobacter artigasi]
MPNSASFFPHAPLSEAPSVSIIALCHNHAPFLREALDSILAQTYPHLEVWLVDDASTDGSPDILREYAARHPTWHLLLLPENVGNCRAFNTALLQSEGELVIDFATDDVLLPARVAQQVAQFQAADTVVGMVYSNCELIDEAGHSLGLHHRPNGPSQLRPAPASGWVFAEVLRRYFISTPTMMMRRACLQSLGGYDDTLAYEDFDFWVRASRDWQFLYLDEVTTRKRKHPRSMSAKAYQRHDPYLASTIRVCTKALALARTPAERAALAVRLRWELRQAVRRHRYAEARALSQLLGQTTRLTLLDRALAAWSKLLE